MTAHEHGRAVYAISVAAELVGTNVQNLRVYERRGLLSPSRTEGGTRLYSRADLDRLTRIVELLEAGVNLAGIALVLDLEADNARLRARSAPRAGAGSRPSGRRGHGPDRLGDEAREDGGAAAADVGQA